MALLFFVTAACPASKVAVVLWLLVTISCVARRRSGCSGQDEFSGGFLIRKYTRIQLPGKFRPPPVKKKGVTNMLCRGLGTLCNCETMRGVYTSLKVICLPCILLFGWRNNCHSMLWIPISMPVSHRTGNAAIGVVHCVLFVSKKPWTPNVINCWLLDFILQERKCCAYNFFQVQKHNQNRQMLLIPKMPKSTTVESN